MQMLIGNTFNRLTVIEIAGKSKRGVQLWKCRCVCGTIKVCAGADLKRGHTKSCGCHHKEMASVANATHRLSNSPEYNSWTNMIARCENPKHPRFKDYGGRGIIICRKWRDSFSAFFSDLGPKPSLKHSIERLDTNGRYCKSNCKWGSVSEQANNTRVNRILLHEGRSLSIAQWSKEKEPSQRLIWARLRLGWTIAETLETPVSRSNKLKSIRH